jgi:hypothetical protein
VLSSAHPLATNQLTLWCTLSLNTEGLNATDPQNISKEANDYADCVLVAAHVNAFWDFAWQSSKGTWIAPATNLATNLALGAANLITVQQVVLGIKPASSLGNSAVWIPLALSAYQSFGDNSAGADIPFDPNAIGYVLNFEPPTTGHTMVNSLISLKYNGYALITLSQLTSGLCYRLNCTPSSDPSSAIYTARCHPLPLATYLTPTPSYHHTILLPPHALTSYCVSPRVGQPISMVLSSAHSLATHHVSQH